LASSGDAAIIGAADRGTPYVPTRRPLGRRECVQHVSRSFMRASAIATAFPTVAPEFSLPILLPGLASAAISPPSDPPAIGPRARRDYVQRAAANIQPANRSTPHVPTRRHLRRARCILHVSR